MSNPTMSNPICAVAAPVLADPCARLANVLQSDGLVTTGCSSSLHPAGSLRVRRVAAAAEIAALAGDWNRLAGDVPFRRPDWLEPWWRHYRLPDWELFVLVVEDAASRVVGLAPWYLASTPGQGRVLRFLGSGEVCSEYLTVSSQAGMERATATALAEWLSGEASDDWDLLELSPVESGDPGLKELVAQFAERGHTVHQRPGMDCWRIELPSSWDEYLEMLSSSRRKKIRQSLRRDFDTGKAQTHLLTSSADVERCFEMFVDLHQRRRRSLGQPGCFASRKFSEFHREIIRRFLALSKLRLMWTQFEGRPVAAEYDLVGGEVVYYYQTGIDPDLADLNPGSLEMIGSLKGAIEQGYRSFDFLRGDEAYKASWGALPRPMVETRIVARRSMARLRHAAWLAREGVRVWAKRGFESIVRPASRAAK
jgi:CelD/BcsL family acetyltransferase involved in cellulose biosynthesis